jgi:hypothetical protein
MPCYAHLGNIAIDEHDGTSPWCSRFGSHFPGTAIPFGAAVRFEPSPAKSKPSKAEPTLQFGVFFGYPLAPGGKMEWGVSCGRCR